MSRGAPSLDPRALVRSRRSAAAAVAGGVGAWFALRRAIRPGTREGDAEVGRLVDHTGYDPEDGSVYSVQTATLTLPTAELDEIWSPMHLERLARTYWRYMQRFSGGLLQVRYDDRGRYVCPRGVPAPLLGFHEPEYELDATTGLVRWRLGRGLLISRAGRDRGFLEIEVHRKDEVRPGMSQAYVEIEVTSFFPAVASGLAYSIYSMTQSRMHVLLAYGFLRSLARRDLEESVVGRFVPSVAEEQDGEDGLWPRGVVGRVRPRDGLVAGREGLEVHRAFRSARRGRTSGRPRGRRRPAARR